MVSMQLTDFASITVFAAVIVHEPVYADSTTPLGTPVLFGPGQQPPHGSELPGVHAAPLQAPDGGGVGGGLTGGAGWPDGLDGAAGVGEPGLGADGFAGSGFFATGFSSVLLSVGVGDATVWASGLLALLATCR